MSPPSSARSPCSTRSRTEARSSARTSSRDGRASTRAPCRASSRHSRARASSSTSPRAGGTGSEYGCCKLGNAVLARLDLRDIARPHLQSLVAETGETATLSAPDDRDAVTVDFVQSASSVQSVARVGRPSVGHATATGKVMLAFGSANGASGQLKAYTKRTITDSRRLAAELRARTEGRVRRGDRRAGGAPERHRRSDLRSAWRARGDHGRPGSCAPLQPGRNAEPPSVRCSAGRQRSRRLSALLRTELGEPRGPRRCTPGTSSKGLPCAGTSLQPPCSRLHSRFRVSPLPRPGKRVDLRTRPGTLTGDHRPGRRWETGRRSAPSSTSAATFPRCSGRHPTRRSGQSRRARSAFATRSCTSSRAERDPEPRRPVRLSVRQAGPADLHEARPAVLEHG